MKLRSGTLLEEISPTITLNKNDKVEIVHYIGSIWSKTVAQMFDIVNDFQ